MKNSKSGQGTTTKPSVWRCECGEKHDIPKPQDDERATFRCPSCDTTYNLVLFDDEWKAQPKILASPMRDDEPLKRWHWQGLENVAEGAIQELVRRYELDGRNATDSQAFPGRLLLSEALGRIADDAIKALVILAKDHGAIRAVDWLSAHQKLGKLKMHYLAPFNIETVLTKQGDERTRTRWETMKGKLGVHNSKAPKSPLTAWVNKLHDECRHYALFSFECPYLADADGNRTRWKSGTKGHMKLEGWKCQVPFPGKWLNDQRVEDFVDEIAIPYLKNAGDEFAESLGLNQGGYKDRHGKTNWPKIQKILISDLNR